MIQLLMIKIYQDLLLKSVLKFMINQEEIMILIYVIFYAYVAVKGDITVGAPNNAKNKIK